MNNKEFGIITFTNEKYSSLCEQLVNSILEFTSFNITVFTTNFNKQSTNQRVSYVAVETTANNQPQIEARSQWRKTVYDKLKICSLTPYDTTFYLDGDIVVTKEFEPWINSTLTEIKNNKGLFCTQHPYNPSTVYHPTTPYLNNFFNMFGVEKIPNYIFTAAFGFNKDFIPHFIKMYEITKELQKNQIEPLSGEESVINLYLYKKNINFNCGYDFIPYYGEGMFDAYMNNTIETCEKYLKEYTHRPLKTVLFHGNKDPNYSKHMIEQIKAKN